MRINVVVNNTSRYIREYWPNISWHRMVLQNVPYKLLHASIFGTKRWTSVMWESHVQGTGFSIIPVMRSLPFSISNGVWPSHSPRQPDSVHPAFTQHCQEWALSWALGIQSTRHSPCSLGAQLWLGKKRDTLLVG